MNKRIRWLVAGWALASVVRRLSQRTGVTDAEAYGTLPGDDVIAHPMVEWTRGITVRATPERIWPWLVQMGYGRAGSYTPTWVDRILEPTLDLRTAAGRGRSVTTPRPGLDEPGRHPPAPRSPKPGRTAHPDGASNPIAGRRRHPQ